MQNELLLLSKSFTDNFENFSCDLVAVSYIPPLLKPTPTDNIIATAEQIEQMAGQTTNAIIGGLSAIGAAIEGGILWRTRWITSKNNQMVRDTDRNLCEYVELVNKAWSIPSVSWLKDIKNCGSIAIYRPTAFEIQVGWSTIKTKYGMERIYQDMVIYQPFLVASHINKQTNTFASSLFSKDKKYGIRNNSNCKG